MTTTSTTPDAPAKKSAGRKIGIGISVLVGAFLVFDAVGKLVGFQQVKDGTAALGFPASQALVMGVVLSVCVLVYAIPRTAVLGALGLTAYLGVLMWVGMVLRRPELLRVAGITR